MTMQADELRELRKQAGLTQGELAAELGLTPQFVGMMERGEKSIELRTELAVRYTLFRRQPAVERLTIRASDVRWQEIEEGWSGDIGPFTAILLRQSRGRWKVALRHRNGYSPEWPSWEDDLASAKASALLNAQIGLIKMAEHAANDPRR